MSVQAGTDPFNSALQRAKEVRVSFIFIILVTCSFVCIISQGEYPLIMNSPVMTSPGYGFLRSVAILGISSGYQFSWERVFWI